MQEGPWTKYQTQAPSAPNAPPPVIYGAPDPYKAEDQSMQRDANRRADEAAARQREQLSLSQQANERANAQAQRQSNPTNQASEGERKNASFVRRALGANDIYNSLKIGPRSYVGDAVAGAAPGLLNQLPSSVGNSEARQQADAAQLEFIAAVLRSDSGAAIPPEEIATATKQYFPLPGEGPKVIAQKAAARQRAIDGLRSAAGRMDPSAELAKAGPDAASNQDGVPPGFRRYTTTTPEGKNIDFFLPEGSTLDQVTAANEAAIAQQDPGNTHSSVADGSVTAQPSNAAYFASGVGDVVQFGGDTLGVVGNPLNRAINAATGSNLSTDLGQSARDASGLPDISNPYAKAITQGGLAAMSGVGIARGLGRALGVGAEAVVTGGGGGGTTGGVVRTLAENPGRQTVAGVTSGASAQAAKDAGLGPVGQVGAALVGGVAGYKGGGVLTGERAVMQPNALAQAAERQKVQLMPADQGGPMTRRVTSAAAQGPLSAGPVIRAAQKSQAQMGQALKRTANNEGAILPPDEAGQAIREGGKLYIKNQTARISRIYDSAQSGAKGVTIKPKAALAQIDGQIARLSEMSGTNAPLLKQLETLKGDIADGVSVSGLRDARTSLSQGVYDGKLRSTQEKQIYRDVLDGISKDIEAGLRQAGRDGAANRFAVADKLWKQRIEQIDEVLQPVIGKGKSGEDIVKAVEGMARGQRGGVDRLDRLLREMPDQQASDIRATIADRMGQATAGQQNDVGDVFSASTFLTNWSKMSVKGKAALFGDGQLRRNLNDIAKLADATKQAQRYANHSNTGGAVGGMATGVNLAAMLYAPITSASALTGQVLTGRLMASPRFTAWLARIPANPAAQTRYIEKLGVIASREPIIANDIGRLQQALQQLPTSAAAKDQPADSGTAPPQR